MLNNVWQGNRVQVTEIAERVLGIHVPNIEF